MGQKVNPHGLRVGVIKDWDSRWFASKKDFSDNLVEDHKIRTELKALLKDAGVPKIEIERTVDSSTSAPRVTVNIYCAKPGMVIGKGGEERVALQSKLSKEYGKNVVVNVIEVKSPSTNAQLVAEDIARQLENRVTFRRAMKQCIRNAMSPPRPQHRPRQGHQGYGVGPSGWRRHRPHRELPRGHHPPADPARRHRLRLCRGCHHLRPHRRQGVDLQGRGPQERKDC